MKLFNDEFQEGLKESIISLMRDAHHTFMKERTEQCRYLQQKDARAYIGGITGDDFNRLVKNGLPEIQLGPSAKHKRYDKKDIDEFMAKYKM